MGPIQQALKQDSLNALVLYLAVFAVVDRPLTLGDLRSQLDYKMAYGSRLSSPKILIFGGSNGRYSHRCGPISAVVGHPCASSEVMHSGAQNAVLLRYRPQYLRSLGCRRTVEAQGAFDLSFLIRGLTEMALAPRDFRKANRHRHPDRARRCWWLFSDAPGKTASS